MGQKKLIRAKIGCACMTKNKDEPDTLNEKVEFLNLPLHTERKADGIYRNTRRVPKSLTKSVGKGYLYRNLGRAKKRKRLLQTGLQLTQKLNRSFWRHSRALRMLKNLCEKKITEPWCCSLLKNTLVNKPMSC